MHHRKGKSQLLLICLSAGTDGIIKAVIAWHFEISYVPGTSLNSTKDIAVIAKEVLEPIRRSKLNNKVSPLSVTPQQLPLYPLNSMSKLLITGATPRPPPGVASPPRLEITAFVKEENLKQFSLYIQALCTYRVVLLRH